MGQTVTNRYSIESGKLVARDPRTGEIRWSNDFSGCPVLKVLPLADGGDCLVLLDFGASRQPTFENLFRVGTTGEIVWRADLPQSHDAYVDVQQSDDGIVGNTWLGARVRIDLSTGHVHWLSFTK
jgi:hypothetical protein